MSLAKMSKSMSFSRLLLITIYMGLTACWSEDNSSMNKSEALNMEKSDSFNLNGMTQKGLFKTKNAPSVLPETELASFAAGCFWGVEQEFRKTKGVFATAVGYQGGHLSNPSYESVCSGKTGHAESVLVEYDPKIVTYRQLLTLFWDLHDPTTLNRQGPDVGEQYRSAIFYYSQTQKKEAEESLKNLQNSGELDGKIVTEILPEVTFWKAEGYHQQYVEKGGRAACHFRRKK